MKKLLAMVLALVMTLSLCTVTNAFADDKDINEDYAEAVDTLNGMGVFKGYEDGSFKPNGNITRAEVAAIIYRLYTGDVKDKQAGLYAGYGSFSDMAGATWAAGYVGYCANAGFVKGYGNGKFGPSDPVTGYQALAMILRAVGYGKNGEFEGADWELHVAQIAQQVGALDNVKGVSLKAAASRELVAELLFQVAAYVPTVTYTPALGYNQYTTLNGKTENDTLGEINFDLTKADEDDDEFGRPVYSWTNGKTGSKKVTYSTVYAKPLFTFVEATKNCDIYDESGLKKGTELDVYTNSATKDDTSYTIADNTKEYGEQGRLTEVYEDRIVNIDTYLAEVGKVVAEKTDSKGHVTKAYVLVDEIYGLDDFTAKFETEGFEKGDFVLVTVADGEIQSMVAAESKVGTLTKVSGNAKSITDLTKVKGIDKEDVAANHTAKYLPGRVLELGSTYNFYYDTYGNVIGADNLALNYVVLDDLYVNTNNGDDTAYGTVYFFDGEKDADVVIDEIGNDDVNDFYTRSSRNYGYYHKVYSYTKDDGVYTLDESDFVYANEAEYRAGSKFMMDWDIGEQLQLSKNSQILLQTKDSPDGTFKAYTGYENLPSFESDNIWYKIDSNGYVSLLYAQADEFSSRTVFVYDTTPSYSWINDDGDKIATMKVLELVDDELKDTTVDLVYDANDETLTVEDIDHIGLYEITEGEDGIWYAIDQYFAYEIEKVTDDGKRVLINGFSEDLDDAKIVKYVGTEVKGDYDLDWTHEDLVADGDAFGYVQYDEDDNVLVVYDLFGTVPVYVDGTMTKDVEYFGRDFAPITVDLPEYGMIDSAEMEQYDDEAIELAVTYFDKNGDEVTMNEGAGTKVAYAEISFNGKVTGDVAITTGTQAAYTNAKLTAVLDKKFNSGTQSFSINNMYNSSVPQLEYTIVVDKAPEGDVSAANLIDALKPFLGTNFQKILGVFNTQGTVPYTGDLTPNGFKLLEGYEGSDFIVRVQAWDGKTVQVYHIVFGSTDIN